MSRSRQAEDMSINVADARVHEGDVPAGGARRRMPSFLRHNTMPARTSPQPQLGRFSFSWGSLPAFPSASLSASLNGVRALNRGRYPLLPSATDSSDGSTTIATDTTTEPATARKLMHKASFMSRSYGKLCKLHNKVTSETTPLTANKAEPYSTEQPATKPAQESPRTTVAPPVAAAQAAKGEKAEAKATEEGGAHWGSGGRLLDMTQSFRKKNSERTDKSLGCVSSSLVVPIVGVSATTAVSSSLLPIPGQDFEDNENDDTAIGLLTPPPPLPSATWMTSSVAKRRATAATTTGATSQGGGTVEEAEASGRMVEEAERSSSGSGDHGVWDLSLDVDDSDGWAVGRISSSNNNNTNNSKKRDSPATAVLRDNTSAGDDSVASAGRRNSASSSRYGGIDRTSSGVGDDGDDGGGGVGWGHRTPPRTSRSPAGSPGLTPLRGRSRRGWWRRRRDRYPTES